MSKQADRHRRIPRTRATIRATIRVRELAREARHYGVYVK